MPMPNSSINYPTGSSGDHDIVRRNCLALGLPVPLIAWVADSRFNNGFAETLRPHAGSRRDITFSRNNASIFNTASGNPLPGLQMNTASGMAAAQFVSASKNVDLSGNMTVFQIVTPSAHNTLENNVWLMQATSAASGVTACFRISGHTPSTGLDFKPGFQVWQGATAYACVDTNTWATGDRLSLCGVRDAANIYLYREGVQVATAAGPSGALSISDGPINIGCYPDTTATQNLKGETECILIWDQALSPDQIALISANPYILWDDTDDDEVASIGATHDPNILVTVTHNLVFESLPMIPSAQETTINASFSKLGLGGRQMVRIGSRIYAVAVDASKTYVVYTDNEAESWSSEQIVAWPAVGASIAQGAGSQPVLVLSRPGVNKLYTYLRTGTGSWTSGATIGTGNTDACEGFQVLYDNTLYHVIFAARKSSNNSRDVYHRTATAITSWSAATTLDDGDNDGYGADRDRAIAACLDKDGDIHLVYCQHKSNLYKLRYRKRTSGTWGSVEEMEALGNDSSTQNRAIHLTITTTGAKIPWVFGVKWFGGVQQVYGWSKPVSTWTAEGTIAAQNANQGYPCAGVQNLDIPDVVFAGNFSDGRIHYVEKRLGSWNREVMSDDFTNDKPDQVYDPFHKQSQTLEGAFVTVSGSIDVIVTTQLVWGDAAYASGGAAFSHTIQIQGRDRVNTNLSFTQVIALTHAYGTSIASLWTISQVVRGVRDMPRTVTKSAAFSQNIGLTAILSGVTTYYKSITHSLVFDSLVPAANRHHIQEVTHTLHFSQVGPGLEYQLSVDTDIEFGDDNLAQGVHNRGATNSVVFKSVPFLNKSLNLTVTHALVFTSAPVRVRAWVWNSTHFDPAWAAEYESTVTDFIIMGPDEAPTLEMTLPKPDMDDENVLFRRDTAVRRNRTGSGKTFVTPVYQEFKYQWSGFLRKRAEEFRQIIGPLLGKNVRIRDHNGVWHKVKITDNRIVSVQKSPEYVVVGLTFEKTEAVY